MAKTSDLLRAAPGSWTRTSTSCSVSLHSKSGWIGIFGVVLLLLASCVCAFVA